MPLPPSSWIGKDWTIVEKSGVTDVSAGDKPVFTPRSPGRVTLNITCVHPPPSPRPHGRAWAATDCRDIGGNEADGSSPVAFVITSFKDPVTLKERLKCTFNTNVPTPTERRSDATAAGGGSWTAEDGSIGAPPPPPVDD